MTFKEWWSEAEIFAGEGSMDAAEQAWDAAAKEATRICLEQKGPVDLIATGGPVIQNRGRDFAWNEACEYCATEIEQST